MTEPEPLPPGHPLFDLDNVILTPHVGGNASEVFRASSVTPVRLLLEALRGERPRHLINPSAWSRHVERFGARSDQRTGSHGRRSAVRIEVDFARCEGNGQCVIDAPDVFELDRDDNLIVLNYEPPRSTGPRWKRQYARARSGHWRSPMAREGP